MVGEMIFIDYLCMMIFFNTPKPRTMEVLITIGYMFLSAIFLFGVIVVAVNQAEKHSLK